MQTNARTVDADYVIIGGGITAAMLAQKLSDLKPSAAIVVVEAGNRLMDLEARMAARQRNLDYGENIWPGDFIADQAPDGMISRTMAVGGSAQHWGGVCNRFSEEDLRLKSLYGLAVDWPVDWPTLEKYYCEAERRIGVSGEPSPLTGMRRRHEDSPRQCSDGLDNDGDSFVDFQPEFLASGAPNQPFGA